MSECETEGERGGERGDGLKEVYTKITLDMNYNLQANYSPPH